MQLDDLDLTDDLALLSHTQQQIQEKTTSEAAVDFNIHKGKSEILRYNTTCTKQITLDREDSEDVKTFAYLDSITDKHGGSDADVNRQSKSSISTTEEHLELKTTVNQHQDTISNNLLCERTNQITAEEEPLEVDRTHIEESTQLHHKASPHMESSRPKNTLRREMETHKKNEQQLDSRKEGPGQSGLKNAGQRPMLY
ncbi:unnamed protein product [Schistosoma mattheei]|uniref:Uncharacterized protein n=1 Tax=Schistosoma mattheei TaxID=31246 RepID=A0A183PYK1_9TREM|nr:unnamed protein product [Schistosoma mattheei]